MYICYFIIFSVFLSIKLNVKDIMALCIKCELPIALPRSLDMERVSEFKHTSHNADHNPPPVFPP